MVWNTRKRSAPEDKSMRVPRSVSLVYWASGSGIAKDIRILERVLGSLGCRVHHIVTRNRKSRRERILRFLVQMPRLLWKRELQIHVEQIHREQFRFARNNILIPNPEITDAALFPKLEKPPVVFCKSLQAVRLFEAHGLPAVYTGFTSEDNLNTAHRKNFGEFLHLAGASNFKGTATVHRLWLKHPEWPRLTIIRTLKDCYGNSRSHLTGADNIEVIERWIPDEELSERQNTCGVHLCPSEMEGFGHYILEGLSAGSLVVTTDAPPMNELVDASCGFLVEARLQGKSYMEDRWSVREDALENCIEKLLAMDDKELARMGESARDRYLMISNAFPGNFKKAIHELEG